MAVALERVKQLLEDRSLFPFPFSVDCCLVDLSPVFDGDNIKDEDGDAHVLSLTCLDPLRSPANEEEFLPEKIFVRGDMKTTFTEMVGFPNKRRKVLVGAPGVGKSVLFFLIALYRAKKEKKVLYYRRTRFEEKVSVFYMAPAVDNQVRVFFSRNMSKVSFSVKDAHLAFTKLFDLGDDDCLKFVDGPNYSDDTANLLEDTFSALCTSRGYPVPPEEIWKIFKLCVLNGWTKEEIVDALHALTDVSEEKAIELYSLCGGRIRRVLEAQEDEAIVKSSLVRLINTANKEMMELALNSGLYSADRNNSDRLRTMFMRNGADVLQIIDSRFVLNGLQQRMNTGDFLKAYNMAKSMGLQGVSGVYFEELLHCWFRTSPPQPVTGFFRDNNLSGAESVAKLTKRLVYWVPGISNFANIDSVLVVGTILYCFQYFVGLKHAFDRDTFWQNVGFPLTTRFGITEIRLYWVVPTTSSFVNTRMEETFEVNVGGKTKSSSNMRSVEMTFFTAKINVDNLDDSPAQFDNFA